MNSTDTRQPTEDLGPSAVGPGLRERKKQQMREDLSRAALRLAIERGPENVRIEDVTTAVGVSYRTFANYFGSREEAIVAVAVDRTARIVDLFQARPAAEPLAEALVQAFTSPYRDSDSDSDSDSAFPAASDAGSVGSSPDEAWLPRVRQVMAAPTLIGAYLAARLDSERALTEAIATRTHTDPAHDLSPRVLAAAVLGAEHAAVKFWLDSGSVGSASPLVRQAIEQVVVAHS